MREHGVDMPDPKPGDGGIPIGGQGTGIDPEDPTFQKAQKACESSCAGPCEGTDGARRPVRPRRGGRAGPAGRW